MKRITPATTTVVRVEILGGANNTKVLTVASDDAPFVMKYLKTLFSKTVTKIKGEDVPVLDKRGREGIRIRVYEHTGSEKGDQRQFSLYGLSTDQISKFIKKMVDESPVLEMNDKTPQLVTRIEFINKDKKQSKTISVGDSNPKEVTEFIQSHFKNKKVSIDVNVFNGKKQRPEIETVMVRVFPVRGQDKGDQEQFTLYGMTVNEIYNEISSILD